MTKKPIFDVDLSETAQSSLAAHHLLCLTDPSQTFHLRRNLRPPLGIYNVSVDRICQKVMRFCGAMEALLPSNIGADPKSAQELIDYIELSLYAAAEHIDDLKLIADNFYESDVARKRCRALRQFAEEIKSHKRFVSTFANLIKHSQSRVRLFSLSFSHGRNTGILHGYFVEGVNNGVVGTNSVFHDAHKSIFSVTSLAWEIICLLLRCSGEYVIHPPFEKR